MATKFKGLKAHIKDRLKEGYSRHQLYEMADDFKEQYGVSVDSFKRMVRMIDNKSKKKSTQPIQSSELDALNAEIEKKKQELRLLSKSNYIKEMQQRVIEAEAEAEAANNMFEKFEKTLQNIQKHKLYYEPIREYENIIQDTAVLIFTDIHFQQIVKFYNDFQNLNAYDEDIAKKRTQYVGDETIRMLREKNIKKIKIALQGDIFNGLIHDELKYGVEQSLTDAIVEFTQCMSFVLQEINKEFDLQVICVSGNHGRFSKKIEFEHKATNNHDYMFYRFLEMANPNVKFIIPKECFHLENINGENYLFAHGDYIRGGKNITGAPAITGSRDTALMNRIYSMVGKTNIYAVFVGHHHTTFNVPGLTTKVLGSPSMVGPGGYSLNNALAYPAAQNLYVIDAEGRLQSTNEIYCNHIMS